MVDKDIRAALAYDESIALGIIEPLYCSLFWHRFLATYEFAFQSNPRFAQASTLVFGAPNENKLSHRWWNRAVLRISVLKLSCANFLAGQRLDAMKGCKAWAKRAHACDYEKQHNNPS